MDLQAVNRGFSRKAGQYDAYGAGHPAIRWARGQVRGQVMRVAAPGARILELNAGTGEDAACLAERGYHVHATDLADGMVAEIARKAASPAAAGRLTVQQISFLELDRLAEGPYDLVLSNFGGLNCVPAEGLRAAAGGLPRVLRPGGGVVWVVMPPVCPWEIAQALRGRWEVAGRRLRGRSVAQVEGARFPAYYFAPAQVARALGVDFELVHVQSLALFSPPAFMDGFPRRFPRLYRWLAGLDERLGHWPPFNAWGDFFILTARYRPR
jgi:SAM-dependent methyltransferase